MPPALWPSSKALTAVFFLSISISGGEAAYWSDEKSWKKLDEGRDPECSIKKDGRDCTLKSVSAVTGTACSQHEQRCFVPSNDKDGDHRMFSAPREKDRPYLFAWTHARILAGLGLLTVGYERTGNDGPKYAVVPRKLWNMDSFPDPSKSDASYSDGFTAKKDLRLVLRPSALRLMWSGILDLLVAGFREDALSFLETGAAVSNRGEIVGKLEQLCPAGGASPPADVYCPSLRNAMLSWWPLKESGAGQCGQGQANQATSLADYMKIMWQTADEDIAHMANGASLVATLDAALQRASSVERGKLQQPESDEVASLEVQLKRMAQIMREAEEVKLCGGEEGDWQELTQLNEAIRARLSAPQGPTAAYIMSGVKTATTLV
jgi:hypothetical protein